MADSTTDPVVHAYLQELEAALAGLPDDVRDGILSGVTEELTGLDSAGSLQRIQQLGDPQFIASEAHAETDAAPRSTQTLAPTPESPIPSRWYEIIAALVVMVGGLLVPIVGTVAGLVMVWFSRVWTRREKWMATLTPVAVIALAIVVGVVSTAAAAPAPGTTEETRNPLIPGFIDVAMMALMLMAVAQAGVGIWLLVRSRGTRTPAIAELQLPIAR